MMKEYLCIPFFALAMLPFVFPVDAQGGGDQELPAEWRVKGIEFEGNRHYSDDFLRGLMQMEKGDAFRQWQLDEDLEVIEGYYQRNGFLDFTLEEVVKDSDAQRGSISIRISLDEGRRVLFREVTFEGNRLLPDDGLRKILDLSRGEPYQPAKVNKLFQELTDFYSERGFIRLQVNSQTQLSAEGDSIDLSVILDEGPRVHFGVVAVEGQERVSEGIILKGSRLRRGDVATTLRLQEAQQGIYQTNLFRNINLSLQDTEDPDTVDVLISVKESDFKTFNVGGGYGSIDGIRASIEWNQYHIFSRAEAVQTKTEVTYQPFELSRIRFSNAYATAFTQPYFLNTLVRAQWSLSYKISDYLTYNQEVVSFKSLFTRTFTVAKRLSFLGDFNSTRIFGIDQEEASQDVRESEGRQVANSLTVTFVLDKRKDFFYPEKKDFLTVETTLSGGPFLGEVDFYRLFADYARYHLLSERYFRPVIAGRLKLGMVRGFGTPETVLPGEQFSIGGANTLRGYKEQSIGPLGAAGDFNTHSGNFIILFNLETRFQFWEKIGGVLFFDSGNVYDTDFYPRHPFLLTSFGAGIHYRSPIGPVRLEGALRIDRNLSFRSGVGRVHFSVGQAF